MWHHPPRGKMTNVAEQDDNLKIEQNVEFEVTVSSSIDKEHQTL